VPFPDGEGHFFQIGERLPLREPKNRDYDIFVEENAKSRIPIYVIFALDDNTKNIFHHEKNFSNFTGSSLLPYRRIRSAGRT
jgi:hypothetical protein